MPWSSQSQRRMMWLGSTRRRDALRRTLIDILQRRRQSLRRWRAYARHQAKYPAVAR
ncbi:hypothetical protein MIND_01252600 [Mycena indigotica]|uniref:Uncharacterized protein n=1 Tax=Mycena indigotica TaxID=2126181 RepID=A0A8H6S4F9_9AGAR|nr:uncharacterized protein MIND_01252600 [Mycena indigotica]KAF7292252.1 hypothetical protein MIND_01252600 [Mycena indigotica]